MRGTGEIICDVKDCLPVTELEAKLALVAMCNMEHFIRHDLDHLIEAIDKGDPPAKLKMLADFAKGTKELMFNARKKPVDEWLGPSGIPGTPENTAMMEGGRKLFKAATGLDL